MGELRWEVEAANVRLIVAVGDGRVYRSRPFRRDLVELALAYAADGRPITVTIINTSPLAERRVLLHPTLVDTALGRSVIRADMIIFNVISGRPWYQEAYQSVRSQIELYRRAWAIRQLAMADLKLLNPEYVELLKDVVNQGPVEPLAAALRDPDSIRDAQKSLLTAKPEYFDRELVNWLIANSGSHRSLAEFDARIREQAVQGLSESSRWLKTRDEDVRALNSLVEAFNRRAKSADGFSSEAEFQLERQRIVERSEQHDARANSESNRLNRIFRRWTAPVPEIAHVSSLRERPFEPTLADCFVVDGVKLPSMVDYLIQITFETLPYFLKDEPPELENKAAREALAAYNDPKPWEFPRSPAAFGSSCRRRWTTSRRWPRTGRRWPRSPSSRSCNACSASR